MKAQKDIFKNVMGTRNLLTEPNERVMQPWFGKLRVLNQELFFDTIIINR